eukprot:s3271_g15.t1
MAARTSAVKRLRLLLALAVSIGCLASAFVAPSKVQHPDRGTQGAVTRLDVLVYQGFVLGLSSVVAVLPFHHKSCESSKNCNHNDSSSASKAMSGIEPGEELKVVAGNESPVLLRDLPATLTSSDLQPFLESYGYQAKSPSEWCSWKPLPELALRVCGHTKVDGHMYYDVTCALSEPGKWHSPYLAWRTLRRLCHLREGLHDPVKKLPRPESA